VAQGMKVKVRVRDTEETCFDSVKGPSRIMPVVLMKLDTGMVDHTIVTEETGGSESGRCIVENQMAADLSRKAS